MTRSIYQARSHMDAWLADRGLGNGPVEIDACEVEELPGTVMLYASTQRGTFHALFNWPPGYPFWFSDVERFFLQGKRTFEWC